MNNEGLIQKVGDTEYIFYKQCNDDMIRLDVFKDKEFNDVEEFKNYHILDSWGNGDRTTYYIKPNKDSYTDSAGLTYRTSSMYVYTDRDGNYRTFSDDTKRHLERCERSVTIYKELLERALNRNKTEDIELYRKWIKNDEKQIEKLKKDLMKGY